MDGCLPKALWEYRKRAMEAERECVCVWYCFYYLMSLLSDSLYNIIMDVPIGVYNRVWACESVCVFEFVFC